ncbi:MAG TPA: chorismate mutase [Aestuariivirgaceae bacterium]|nr:chorismate mutase [Aestuariivirgaceae bacterium]
MEKPVSPPNLEGLRREIDDADRALLDQLERRFSAVERVKAVKQAGGRRAQHPMRPAREAQILRQLLARKPGNIPASLLVRLWRSIISSATSLQAKVTVHIGQDVEGDHGLRDLVRDHFPDLSLSIGANDTEVVGRLAASPFDVAAVKAEGDWIVPAIKNLGHGIHVMSVLPLLAPQGQPPRIIILGRAAAEPSGKDQTLIALAGEGQQAFKDAIWTLPAGGYRLSGLEGFLEEKNAVPAGAFMLGRCPQSLGGGT